jgi:hypothetical protein
LPVAWMVGCRGTVGEATGTTTAPPVSSVGAAAAVGAPKVTETTPRKAFRHYGGPAAPFLYAAQRVTLTASQSSSLAAVEAALDADENVVHVAMTAFHADLVAGVKADAIDMAKLAADGTIVESAVAEHRARQAAALVSLHDLLDPTQRSALVAAARAKQAEHEAHVAEWKAKGAPGAHADLQKRRLDKLTADLALDAAQQQKVATLLAEAKEPPHDRTMDSRREEMKQHEDALLTEFAGDMFDAAKVQPKAPPEVAPRPMTEHLVSFVSKMLPLLRPDQRKKFALNLKTDFHGGSHQGPHD